MEGASFRSPRGSYATGMYMQARRIKGGAPAPGAPPPPFLRRCRITKYFIRIHINVPPLVSEALTLLKNAPNKRNNWYTATSEIIMKCTCNQSINANQIVLKEVKRNLQESFINIWKEQLWDDNRVTGGNKLRTYRTFKKDCVGMLFD